MEVRNKLKELDLIECLMNYGWRFMRLYTRQGLRPSQGEKKCRKKKWLSEKILQIAEKRKEAKSNREEER